MTNEEAIKHLLYMKRGVQADSEQDEALDAAISALNRGLYYVVLGENEKSDKLVSFGRNEDGLFGFTIYHLTKPREYGFIHDTDYEVDGEYFTILFGKKNGLRILHHFIHALSRMEEDMESLAEVEE